MQKTTFAWRQGLVDKKIQIMSFEFCQLDERLSESQECAQKLSQNFKLLNSIIGH